MTGTDGRLTLDGADDGHLLLVDEDGGRYRLPVDDDLRTALGSPAATAAPPPAEEVTMDTASSTGPTALRPRDIQARIRAGATAEEVAASAGSTVEKVMVYARPVLAERAHMAQRAQRSSVRRSGGDGSGHRTLGDAVEQRLRRIDEDPGGVEWDSRKREDGRWALTAAYATGARTGLGGFTFDPPGNFVVLEDDDARWLVGDEPPAPVVASRDEAAPVADPDPGPGPGPDSGQGAGADAGTDQPGPRLVAVADDELPLGGDALQLVEDGTTEYRVDVEPAAGGDEAAEPAGAAPEQSDVEAGPDDEPDPPSRRRGRKRGRASVPSWDEIMFGGRRE